MFTFINETISGRFNQQDTEELYLQADATEKKYQDFNERCVNSPSGPYLKYLGTSSTVRDLVSLGDAIVGQGEPIDYWGVSYGTVLGFNFLNSEFCRPFYRNKCLTKNLSQCSLRYDHFRSDIPHRAKYMQRAGHVILDGVVDPSAWISHKVSLNVTTAGIVAHPWHQSLRSFLVDTEKTYSGLTDGCAAAGRAGCKLIEITGDGATGDDVKNLINDAHDVINSFLDQDHHLSSVHFRWLLSSTVPDMRSLLILAS